MIASMGNMDGQISLTVDPIRISDEMVQKREQWAFGGETISATAPAQQKRSAWPWILGAVLLGGLYVLTRDPKEDRRGGPFVE